MKIKFSVLDLKFKSKTEIMLRLVKQSTGLTKDLKDYIENMQLEKQVVLEFFYSKDMVFIKTLNQKLTIKNGEINSVTY